MTEPAPAQMNADVLASRQTISRRRALALGGTVGMSGVLAACASGTTTTSSATTTAAADSAATTTAAAATTTASSDLPTVLRGLLDESSVCMTTKEVTQGPYYFDVDMIRRDITEDRPGIPLELALRVLDCGAAADGGDEPITNAVVEIWHCDAGGEYSGFEQASQNPGGGGGAAPTGGAPGGQPPTGGPGDQPPADGGAGGTAPGTESGGSVSDGSYSSGEQEATTTDDGTYLRGAQATDSEGIAYFTTIYPGWYRGRTVHVHLKVHVDRTTVLTAQVYFPEDLNDAIFAEVSPYDEHTGRDTTNATDSIYDATGLMAVSRADDRVYAAVNIGLS